MIILRWLLCHLIIITVLASLSLGYVFRGSFKDDFNRLTSKVNPQEKIDKTPGYSDSTNIVSSDKAVPASSVTNEAKIDRPSSGTPEVGKPHQSSSPHAKVSQSTSQQENYILPESSATNVINANGPWGQLGLSKSNIDQSRAIADKAAATSNGSIFPPDNYNPEENGSGSGNPEKEKSDTQVLTSTSASPADMPDTLSSNPANYDTTTRPTEYLSALADVRQLYWNGKTAQAQALYEKLMFEYPEQPEAAAELGNIFLQQGNRKAASWAYQNALPRYLKLHREQEAINLTNFISQYDPAIAESLHKKYW